MSAQREQLDHSTVSGTAANAGEAPAVPVNNECFSSVSVNRMSHARVPDRICILSKVKKQLARTNHQF